MIIGVVIAFAGIFLAHFIDLFGNGIFREWFYSRFIKRIPADGTEYPVFYNWADFKNFIIGVMIAVLVIVSAIIVLIMNYTNSRKSQEMKNTIEAQRLRRSVMNSCCRWNLSARAI